MEKRKRNWIIFLGFFLFVISLSINALRLVAEERRISVVAVGDCIINRPLSLYSEENYLKLIDLLRKADIAYGNMEGTIHENKGSPGYKSWDVNLIAEPFIADELKWAGFDLMGMANNHTLDYLIEGMLATQKNLDRVGIVHAGTGRNLEEASAPAYFESKRGRIALVNCASSFPSYFMASATRGDMEGRPGLNPLRLTNTYQVTKSDLEILKQMGAALTSGLPRIVRPEEQVFTFRGVGRFRVGTERALIVEADDMDVKRITNAVRRARRNAHIVIVSIHAHDQSAYLKEFAHACVDAGADCFFGAGPHFLTGLEIYKGKPIFYSLGNFIFQLQTLKTISAEVFEQAELDIIASSTDDFWHVFRKRVMEERRWLAVVPWIVFSDGKLEEIALYPVTLNSEAERAGARGRPFLTDEETGKKIIEKMSALSSSCGTQITFKDEVGRVKIK